MIITSHFLYWAQESFYSALLGFGKVEYSFNIISVCIVFPYNPLSSSVFYYFIVVIVLLAIATVVQLFGCGCIIYITRKHLLKNLRRLRGRTQRGRNSEDSGKDGCRVRSGIVSNYMKSQLQLVKVFGAIVSASLLTMIPVFGTIAAPVTPSSSPLYTIGYLSVMFRAVIHPILEAYMTHEIREIIGKFHPSCVSRCKLCPNSSEQVSGSASSEEQKVWEIQHKPVYWLKHLKNKAELFHTCFVCTSRFLGACRGYRLTPATNNIIAPAVAIIKGPLETLNLTSFYGIYVTPV